MKLLEERRTRAVSLRRGLPDDMQGDLAVFDEDIARQIISQLRPAICRRVIRLLLDLGVLLPALVHLPRSVRRPRVFPIALQRIAKPGSPVRSSGKWRAPKTRRSSPQRCIGTVGLLAEH